MQVTCYAAALKFLARNEPAQQVDALLFGYGPLFYLLQQRGIAFGQLARTLRDPHLEFVVCLLEQLRLSLSLGKVTCDLGISGQRLADIERHHHTAGKEAASVLS